MAIPSEITDHVTQALARLTGTFRKDRIKWLLAEITEEWQKAEGVIFELIEERYLSSAVGAQLDGIGDILGLERLSTQTDTAYRGDLLVWILYLKSYGGPETIIAIVQRFTASPEVELVEYFPGSAIVTFNGTPSSRTRLPVIADGAALGGVRIIVVQRHLDNPFVFFGGAGGPFGTTTDPALGGVFSTVLP